MMVVQTGHFLVAKRSGVRVIRYSWAIRRSSSLFAAAN